MFKKILKKWLHDEILDDFWKEVDDNMKHKHHSHWMWMVETRVYEIKRRYGARIKRTRKHHK